MKIEWGMGKKSVLLSTIFLIATLTFFAQNEVFAEPITAKSVSFEETTVIEFTNDGDVAVNTFRIWLGSDFNFQSFKTEMGWTGERTPQGVLIFTSNEMVQPGDSVKFGIKTDKAKPGINWRAIDEENQDIEIGKTLAEDLPNYTSKETNEKNGGILDNSSFRIIPDKPNVGGTIRVTGNSFSPLQEFDFYLDNKRLTSFETNGDGYFLITTEIPDDVDVERVNFIVRDEMENEKRLSLRLGGLIDRVLDPNQVNLTIKGLDSTFHRGDFLEVSGTARPGSSVTASITNPKGEVISTTPADVDSRGNWELSEPIIVPLDAPFGEYTAKITDGRETIERSWTLTSDKKIVIVPTKSKFNLGETFSFNGTVIPNEPIELALENPLGVEIFSDIIQIDKSGKVEFEFKTNNNMIEGTYTLIARQGNDRELIFAGLGVLPEIPVNLSFDKLNYKTTEKANILLTGKPSEFVSLLIIDPSDKPRGEAVSIQIGPDGRKVYELELTGFSSGIYTAVVSKGNTKSSETFTVGLQTGSGVIDISTTKLSYDAGDPVLVLGGTSPNVLFTITLKDPDGNVVKEFQTYSDKIGKISDGTLRIPTDAKPGMWEIRATSGSNFDTIKVEVTEVVQQGMVVRVTEGQFYPGVGQSVEITVIGAKQTVFIDIVADDGEIIDSLSMPSSDEGMIKQPWIIPKHTNPGTYTVKAHDPFDEAETTFQID